MVLVSKAVDELTFPAYPADLYEPISYILALGGKRLRPALLLMACDLFGGDVESAIEPALAIEVFHNFTLMHDDIMDKAPLRRGKGYRARKMERQCSHTIRRCHDGRGQQIHDEG
jgi:geranylgeranyl diphosphate synthase type II